MPQYEYEPAPTGAETPAAGLHRGRTPADAVARARGAAPGAVAVSDEADVQGWRAVTVDGEPAGRVRAHAARMRFRRD